MSALIEPIDDCSSRPGQAVTRSVAPNVQFYGGGFQQEDSAGAISPLSTTAGRFAGMSMAGARLDPTDTPREVDVAKAALFLVTLAGVTAADLGKPIWATTDNPADLSLTYTAGAKLIGFVDDLEYNTSGIPGPIANRCYVLFDSRVYGNALRENKFVAPSLTSILGTVRQLFYRVSANKAAQLIALHAMTGVAPSYATSLTLNVNKISGGVRTQIATLVVSAAAALADLVVPITSTVQTLAAGDYLELELVGVGTQTTAGSFAVSADFVEYSKIG